MPCADLATLTGTLAAISDQAASYNQPVTDNTANITGFNTSITDLTSRAGPTILDMLKSDVAALEATRDTFINYGSRMDQIETDMLAINGLKTRTTTAEADVVQLEADKLDPALI